MCYHLWSQYCNHSMYFSIQSVVYAPLESLLWYPNRLFGLLGISCSSRNWRITQSVEYYSIISKQMSGPVVNHSGRSSAKTCGMIPSMPSWWYGHHWNCIIKENYISFSNYINCYNNLYNFLITTSSCIIISICNLILPRLLKGYYSWIDIFIHLWNFILIRYIFSNKKTIKIY